MYTTVRVNSPQWCRNVENPVINSTFTQAKVDNYYWPDAILDLSTGLSTSMWIMQITGVWIIHKPVKNVWKTLQK